MRTLVFGAWIGILALAQQVDTSARGEVIIASAESLLEKGERSRARVLLEEQIRRLEPTAGTNLAATRELSNLALFLIMRVDPKSATGLSLLRKQTRQLIETDPPPYQLEGSEGAGKDVSPEFEQWSRTMGEAIPEEALQRIVRATINMNVLGIAGDRDSIPIFVKGLESRQVLVVVGAISALARLGARSHIDKMLRAAERLSSNQANVYALEDALLDSPDPGFRASTRRFFRTDERFNDAVKRHAGSPSIK